MPLKFIYICDLLEELESFEVRNIPLLNAEKILRYETAINRWFKSHRRTLDAPETDRVALLSTLLPERRTDRVYHLKERGLARTLARYLGWGRGRLDILEAWTPSNPKDLATIISEMQKVHDREMASSRITVEEIDSALANLASQCRFSSPRVRAAKSDWNKKNLLDGSVRRILVSLSSREMKWFIRLVIKRFNPVALDEQLILRNMHVLLPCILRFQSSFGAAIRTLESHSMTSNLSECRGRPQNGDDLALIQRIAAESFKPQMGTKVGRPEFVKARSIKHCMQLTGKSRWAIEPKYDGEYCQLHIDLSRGNECIQIFSKSGKDSTRDKQSLHKWILACLKIGQPGCRLRQRCILEGEMVVYSEKDGSILDFSKIRKYVSRSGSHIGTERDSQQHEHEHLMLVFFDALLIDEDVVMTQPYETRRRRLRELINYYPGYCQTADWGSIDFSQLSAGRAARKLEKAFAKAIALRCEGLILKTCDAPYFAGKVVKLKKDYIPGLGDTADFAIIGARHVAAEVTTEARATRWTHFTIACLQNKEAVCRYQQRPVFRTMATLSRPCIPVVDMQYMSDHGQYMTEIQPSRYDVVPGSFGDSTHVYFKKPFIVEVLGSSFDKPPSAKYFMLRHPRILKLHRDRSYQDVTSYNELQELARKAKSVPEDIALEEAEWLHRLQSIHRPNTSQESTQSSRATAVTRRPEAKRGSPARIRRGRMPIPLIRIDTAELLPNENRSDGHATHGGRELSRQLLNVLPTLPPSSPLLQAITPVSRLLASAFKKRKVEAVDLATSDAESRKRPFPPVRLIGNRNSASILPLKDITNSPPSLSNVQRASNLPPGLQEVFTLGGHGVKNAAHSMPVSPQASSILSPIVSASSARTPPLPDISHVHTPHKSQVSPIQKPSADPVQNYALFSTHTFYLAPCVARIPYLTQDLLPALNICLMATSKAALSTTVGIHSTRSLAHWKRQVQLLPPTAPVVSESQAYAGMRKAVIVESKRKQQMHTTLEGVKREVTLGEKEVVEFWDWRVIGECVDMLKARDLVRGGAACHHSAGPEETTEDSRELLKKILQQWYVGCVRWDDETGANVWIEATLPRKMEKARQMLHCEHG